jgi:exosortase A-associated hydrolase 1
MAEHVRTPLSFPCNGATLAATLDHGTATTGLLIVSGGNEIRIGAHRGMAKLAGDIAAQGFPVFRFDRRGIGDSDGENGGFEGSGPDIAAAIAAFKAQCPHITRMVAFGNCDAASALVLHRPEGFDAVILANPWTIEPSETGTPPKAAIKSHYLNKLRDPKALLKLVTGGVNLRKLVGGLGAMTKTEAPSSLALRLGEAMSTLPHPARIILAERDGTAVAFAAEWKLDHFAKARSRNDISLTTIDSSSHSFAEAADYDVLKTEILAALKA